MLSCNLIKSQDLFGHLITFNFGKEGDTHKTALGGVVSVLLKILFAIFVGLNVKTLINYEDNKISKVTLTNDVESESIPLNDLKYAPLVGILD